MALSVSKTISPAPINQCSLRNCKITPTAHSHHANWFHHKVTIALDRNIRLLSVRRISPCSSENNPGSLFSKKRVFPIDHLHKIYRSKSSTDLISRKPGTCAFENFVHLSVSGVQNASCLMPCGSTYPYLSISLPTLITGTIGY